MVQQSQYNRSDGDGDGDDDDGWEDKKRYSRYIIIPQGLLPPTTQYCSRHNRCTVTIDGCLMLLMILLALIKLL
jgi:hypothetical protein